MDDAYFARLHRAYCLHTRKHLHRRKHIHTHTQTPTHKHRHTHSLRAPSLLIDVLHSSVVLFPSLVPLRLLLFIKWSFPSPAPSNESVTPPRTHLSNHVATMHSPAKSLSHTHTHAFHFALSAIMSLSQLGLFVVPLPSIPCSFGRPRLFPTSHCGSRVIVFDSFSFSCQISFHC